MHVECFIVHSIAGRVRLRISNKAVVRSCSLELHRFVLRRSGTISVRINSHCSSVIVDYEPGCLDAQTMATELSQFLGKLQPSCAQFDTAAEAMHARGRSEHEHRSLRRASKASRGGPNGKSFGHVEEIQLREPPVRAITPSRVESRSTLPALASWHDLGADEVVGALGSDADTGLQLEEAGNRLFSFGPNSLGSIERRSAWSTLASQFESLPVALLIGSAAVSVATGGLADAVVILGVVAVNACIGFVTEQQAERTIASLQNESDMPAIVIRAGRRQPLAVELIVPGDLLVLTPGTTVAADVRLIETERLMLDESALTGESMPVKKSPGRLSGNVALRDRPNMAYRGTIVTGGSGLGMAVETGSATEVGRIQELVGLAKAPETPVQVQLGELGTKLGLLTGAVCGGVFGVGLLRGYGMVEMLKIATSLAVAAVPEGLPMVATTTLALGVNRMRRLNVAVRRLDAVETLGSVEVFCLDKTGTLTRNQMRVIRLYAGNHAVTVDENGVVYDDEQVRMVASEELRRLLEVAVLCNETDVRERGGTRALDGSPTESALVHAAMDHGIDVQTLRRAHRVLRTEYRTERRGYMTTLHERGAERRLLAVKGRPSDVLELCRWQLVGGTPIELTEKDRDTIRTENEVMAGKGLRVLGFAFRESLAGDGSIGRNLTWLGLAGIADPIRPGMHDLMHAFHRAGIRTSMITGDQSATAQAIGRELELSGTSELHMMDSIELESLDPDVLKSLAENVDVFSSVTPSHKLEIVQALQRAGRVVAMTGDGINDGPALKAADIGVAMGGHGGTDVARMTADVVLEDNNLQSMVAAIGQGRAIYSNTRNAIRYLLATNMSEIMVMFSSVASGAGMPLNPMQLLWINLVSDIFPVLALAVQPPEDDVLGRAPRDPNEPFLDRSDLTRMLLQSIVITGGTFGSYAWGRYRYRSNAHASTMAFMSITAAQLLHMLSARSERQSIFSIERPPRNQFVNFALFGGFGLQLVTAIIPPLRRLLRNATLTPSDMVVSLLGAGLPFLINEAIKELQPSERPSSSSPDYSSTPEGSSP